MPFERYGVVVGKLTSFKRDDPDNQGRWFHVNVFVDVNGVEHHAAIDVDSKQTSTGVEWKVLELDPAEWTALLGLADGSFPIPMNEHSGALDYVRAPRLASGAWTKGSADDAASALEPLLGNATRVFVFGEPFPNGVHNVHQNQGDPAGSQWWDENGVWQDGGTFVETAGGKLYAFLNKFASQSYTTDDEGHAPYHPPKPKAGSKLQKVWKNSVASLVTQPLPALGKGELERHRIYGHLVAALVAHYWNGNKRGKSGEYPWRTGQLHDGQYDGGDYLGHNIACIVVDGNGEIIDFDFNHNEVFSSSVEHAEARLVRRVFSLTQIYDGWATRALGDPQPSSNYGDQLSAATLYTSLESCAQCAGIMALGRLGRVVFLQRDPGQNSIGNILYNLGGPGQAPLPIPGDTLGLTCFDELDAGYAAFAEGVGAKPFHVAPDGKKDRSASITSYLCTDHAQSTFRAGADALANFAVADPPYKPIDAKGNVIPRALDNAQALVHARQFLAYAKALGKRGTPHKL